MSPREILHRASTTLLKVLEARGWYRAPECSEPDRSAEGANWLQEVQGISTTRYEAAARALLAGEVPVFRLSSGTGASPPRWNRDPSTGIEAPLTFGKAIDYRDERLVGNIKYLWEPNRHLELVTLAQAYALTGEARYLHGIGERLESWMDQCPFPQGVNWASSLELGIRLINWSLAWQLVGRRESALFRGERGERLRKRWLDCIYLHVHFIRHYYSRYSSANNHLIGEAAGVFIAACTWPYWKNLEEWGEEARQILVQEAQVQTHPDGVHREQAIAYQQFVLDFLILAGLAGRATGRVLPGEYWRNIERMIEFIQAVMDVAGNVPMIGDADDGFVVRLSQEEGFCPFRSLLATGAILFDRPDFAAKGGALDDKTRLLLGESRWVDVAARARATPVDHRSQFPHGGYYILGRDFESDCEIRLVADAGPLGYLSIAAHGHADALSFVLSVAGREILVDPGTYSYHTEPLWREYFRGTRAHNTVRIDGQDQSIQGGNFMWLRHAQVRCVEFQCDVQGCRFLGEHDGYRRLADPVIHQREIVQRGTAIGVTDRIICNAYHSVERCWHFSEHCRVSQDDSVIAVEQGPVRVTLRNVAGTGRVKVLRGSENPPGGWVSRRFDVKVPATSVYFLDEIRGTTELKTRIDCTIRGKGG